MAKRKKTVKSKEIKVSRRAKVKEKETAQKTDYYFEAVGRRKTSVARVKLFPSDSKEFMVNNKPLDLYFPLFELRQTAQAALKKVDVAGKFRVSVLVKGGGLHSQAEAVRHGTARALVLFNPDFRKQLKRAGFLTRDPRMRERKKFGLKRARRAPQWSKR